MANPADAHTTASLLPHKKKPLRTYGKKRTFAAIDSSDASNTLTDKRRKANDKENRSLLDDKVSELSDGELQTSNNISATSHISAPKPNTFGKDSILNYFKPRRTASQDYDAAVSAQTKKLSTTSSPSSPPVLKPSRGKRRLMLRPPTPVIVPLELEDNEFPADRAGYSEDQSDSMTDLMTPPMSDASNFDTEDHVNHDLHHGAVDSVPREGPQQDARSQLQNKAVKPPRPKSAPVQTTINLSTKPAFEECRMCRIVYNPLHPNDVKYHAKRHKAIVGRISGR